MHGLIISQEILTKLRDKHGVTQREVEQCFENKCGPYLEDHRPQHKTEPPTCWFVAPTNKMRMLKVVFVHEMGNNYLKSAYEPSQAVVDFYEKHAK